MKPGILISALIAVAFTLTSFAMKAPTLIGKWQGEDEGQVGIITFDKSGYVSFTVDGKVIGGKKYEVEGVVMDMYYETDNSVTPHAIDFVFKLNEDQTELSRMLGIYELVDEKTLILNMKFDGAERPDRMDAGSKDQITLKKVK